MGVTFGTIQIVLYLIYRKNKPAKDQKLPEQKDDVTNDLNANATVSGENKGANTGGLVDIELGEKEEKQTEKKEDQVVNNARDQTEQNHKTREGTQLHATT